MLSDWSSNVSIPVASTPNSIINIVIYIVDYITNRKVIHIYSLIYISIYRYTHYIYLYAYIHI